MFYCGAMSDYRVNRYSQLAGFRCSFLPFNYLGVPIFKVRVKRAHFQALADKMISKLAARKGSTLFYAGRVILVSSVVQGMIYHSISSFSWSISLLREIESAARNFIRSGSFNTKKLVMIA